jgi:ParB family transcriptional regulator, chromosome partitioning protein
MTTSSTSSAPKRGLGRGLSALLGPDSSNTGSAGASGGLNSLMHLPIKRLQAGAYQPRTRMDEGSLQELAASIRLHGIMQPIVVRALTPKSTGDLTLPDNPATQTVRGITMYEIIAGERRFRAAIIAGLNEVPVIVKNVKDQDALALALIENIQREDLNPLEEAQAIKRLLDEFNFSHEQAAEAIGRSRSATSNLLRLLNLVGPVQTMLSAGDLDMGHARALLVLPAIDQITCAQQVVQKSLTVRDTEKLVAKVMQDNITAQALVAGANTAVQSEAAQTSPSALAANNKATQSRDVERLAERLADTLGTKVQLQSNAKGRGKLVIEFANHESFESLLARLGLSDVTLDH